MDNTKENQPRVVNKSGTLKMEDNVAATKPTRDMGGRRMNRRDNRRGRGRGRDEGSKEFDSITISIDRVSRTV